LRNPFVRLSIVTAASATAGAVLTAMLGGALTSAVWVTQSTAEGTERAIVWGMRHGLLIGAVGIVTGAIAGISASALSPRNATRRRAAVLGAGIGAAVSLVLAIAVWSEKSGGPVAAAALAAHTIAGAAIAIVARPAPVLMPID
jgi:hypothetical protein